MKIFVLLSLGGLPPFLGFLGKLYILKISIIMVNSAFLFLLVIIFFKSILMNID